MKNGHHKCAAMRHSVVYFINNFGIIKTSILQKYLYDSFKCLSCKTLFFCNDKINVVTKSEFLESEMKYSQKNVCISYE